MVIVQFRGRLVRQYRIELVSLILLGWNYVSYITVLCVQGILSPLLFMPSLYSTLILYFEEFTCPLSFLITNPNLLIILVTR